MKLLTFEMHAGPRLGALLPGGVLDLTTYGDAAFASMQALIEGGSEAMVRAQKAIASPKGLISPEEITWLSPLPVPAQMRDCLGFEMHVKNAYTAGARLATRNAPDPEAAFQALVDSGRTAPPEIWYRQPIYYKANRFAFAGHEADIVWPSYSTIMDFELEFACVIGRAGRDIARESANDHIFGYTIFNDFTARDAQSVEMGGLLGPAKGKDFDDSNILGPVIVTADEIPDPYNLKMVARVNGETWCEGSSSTMHWQFPDMIAHVSKGETLHVGEVIGSGTVGWGCGMEHMRFLGDGDVVELEVEGIGILRNRVLRAPNGSAK